MDEPFGRVTNRGAWSWNYQLYADGLPADLSVMQEITVALARRHGSNLSETPPALTASLSNGKITVPTPASGVFVVAFTANDMGSLDPATYDVGCTLTDEDGERHQLFIGTVTVRHGVVA